jgi:hypothetical protein
MRMGFERSGPLFFKVNRRKTAAKNKFSRKIRWLSFDKKVGPEFAISLRTTVNSVVQAARWTQWQCARLVARLAIIRRQKYAN